MHSDTTTDDFAASSALRFATKPNLVGATRTPNALSPAADAPSTGGASAVLSISAAASHTANSQFRIDQVLCAADTDAAPSLVLVSSLNEAWNECPLREFNSVVACYLI